MSQASRRMLCRRSLWMVGVDAAIVFVRKTVCITLIGSGKQNEHVGRLRGHVAATGRYARACSSRDCAATASKRLRANKQLEARTLEIRTRLCCAGNRRRCWQSDPSCLSGYEPRRRMPRRSSLRESWEGRGNCNEWVGGLWCA